MQKEQRISLNRAVSFDLDDNIMQIEIISELQENGDIQSFITSNPDIARKENFKKQVANSLAEGLLLLHDNNLLHGNLKPKNILLGPNSGAIITDFGFFSTVTSQKYHPFKHDCKYSSFEIL